MAKTAAATLPSIQSSSLALSPQLYISPHLRRPSRARLIRFTVSLSHHEEGSAMPPTASASASSSSRPPTSTRPISQPSSLSSIVSSVFRRTQTLPTDPTELDAHIASVLLSEASHSASQWTRGEGYVVDRRKEEERTAIRRPNKRFLNGVLRSVGEHNKGLLEKEREVKELMREGRAIGGERQKREDEPREGEERDELPRERNWDDRRRRTREEDHREEDRQRHRSSRHHEDDNDDDRESRRHRHRHGKERVRRDEDRHDDEDDDDDDERRRRRRRKERERDRDRQDEEGEDESRRRRDSDRDKDKDRPRYRENDDDEGNRRKYRRSREQNYDGNKMDADRSKSPTRSNATNSIITDPSPAAVPSKMDKYFAPDYDPLFDVSVPDLTQSNGLIAPGAFDEWDTMLRTIKERKEEKEQRKWEEKRARKEERHEMRRQRRSKRSGKDESSSSGEDNEKRRDKSKRRTGSAAEMTTAEKGVLEMEYAKLGTTREWDRGKESLL